MAAAEYGTIGVEVCTIIGNTGTTVLRRPIVAAEVAADAITTGFVAAGAALGVDLI